MKTKVIGRIIIILIILIAILGGVFAYLYFGTDLLKTNKQLFFQYLGQMVEQEDGFIDNRLSEYSNKKYTGKYEDSGKFYVDINMTGLDADVLQTINDFNIEYSGKVDNTARKNEQEIAINYSDDVNFPIKYKYANETLGLQTNYVSSKYIGIQNENLKEFAEKFGITDTEEIPDKIDLFENINNQTRNFTDEEKEQLKETYKTILQTKLEGKEFTKTQNVETTTYAVELTNQELKDIIIAVLEDLKNNQILLPRIEEMSKETLELMNQNSTEEVTIQDIIQESIDNLNDAEIQNGNISIMVSQTDRKLSGIIIKSEETEISLTKSSTQGVLTYTVEFNSKDTETQDNMRYFMSASYQGLEQLSSVNETYQIGAIITANGEEQKLVYNLNCTDTFKDNINIEDYAEEEIQLLNEYNGEQITTLLSAIGERIGQVNTMQMEEIGFSEYGNPMLYAFPLTSLSLMMYNQATNVVEDNSMSEIEKESFNQKFIQYEGEQRGTATKVLIQAVLTNNISQEDEERKISISGVITLDRDETSVSTDDISTTSRYNIEMNYNENGLIHEIIITEI